MTEHKVLEEADIESMVKLVGERVGVGVYQRDDGGDLSRAIFGYYIGVFQGVTANYEYPDDRAANPANVSYEIDLHNHESPIRVEWDETFSISYWE